MTQLTQQLKRKLFKMKIIVILKEMCFAIFDALSSFTLHLKLNFL